MSDEEPERRSPEGVDKLDLPGDEEDDEPNAAVGDQPKLDSPRVPIFVAGQSPRYSPMKGSAGLVYQPSGSAGSSTTASPRTLTTTGVSVPPVVAAAASSPQPIFHPIPAMSPVRFGQSPVSMSPPAGMSFEDMIKASDSAVNMKLVHEISTTPDFKISPRAVDPNSLEGRIKEMMERVFWDMLKADLEADEPNYEHVISLIEEIREIILKDIIPPNGESMTKRVSEVLDMTVIRQQIANETFDLKQYSAFIIDTLASLCAPVRDERIAALRNIDDTVLLLKEVMKTLDLMKLDMVNFLIAQTKPIVQQNSLQYEREQFEKYLATQKDGNGLQYTREWLYTSREALIVAAPGASSPPTGREILNEAFINLLTWSQAYDKFPETCLVDVEKFQQLSIEMKQLALIASLLLVVLNSIGGSVHESGALVDKIRTNIVAILQHSAGLTSPESITEDLVAEIMRELKSSGKIVDSASEKVISGQLLALKEQHSIKNLLTKRIQKYLKSGLDSASHSNPAALPAALAPIKKELATFTAKFVKVCSYNREVFNPYYTQIITDF